MKYTIHLRDTRTGVTKVHHDDYDWGDESAMLFQWTEGNYSCDCNRSIDFYDDEAKRLECSAGNVIALDKIEDANGLEIPLDG